MGKSELVFTFRICRLKYWVSNTSKSSSSSTLNILLPYLLLFMNFNRLF